jgi:ubiquinone/menaquinone biosynthesis C-methylase UbiE
VRLGDAWEHYAQDWIVWARTENHDGFWEGTWPSLRAVLDPPGELVVEIGCGEGRVGRELLALGHTVVGIEQSPTLARAARDAHPPLTVLRADAGRLPFGDAIAGAVVACMSLHDVDDLGAAIGEAARVVRPGGALCVAMVHPFASAQEGGVRTHAPVFNEPYLSERRYVDRAERDGLEMTFVSMHRPLGTYLSACFDAGFVLSSFAEFGNKPIPWLLVARFEKAS